MYSFDLWEEIESHSFWTTAVQHRSLREGAALASKISESSSGYSSEADNVLCYLQVSIDRLERTYAHLMDDIASRTGMRRVLTSSLTQGVAGLESMPTPR